MSRATLPSGKQRGASTLTETLRVRAVTLSTRRVCRLLGRSAKCGGGAVAVLNAHRKQMSSSDTSAVRSEPLRARAIGATTKCCTLLVSIHTDACFAGRAASTLTSRSRATIARADVARRALVSMIGNERTLAVRSAADRSSPSRGGHHLTCTHRFVVRNDASSVPALGAELVTARAWRRITKNVRLRAERATSE